MKPSFLSIAKADYAAMLALVLPVTGVVLGILKATKLMAIGIPWPALALTVVGLPLAWQRVRSIQSLFACGVRTTGQVLSVWMERDRGRVEFSYEFEGRTYTSGSPLHRTARAESLEQGQQVEVLVDPERPQRSLIPWLYLGGE